MDTDINDIFDSITCKEEIISKQGFDEGFKVGENSGLKEGYHLGYHQGAAIAKEIGHYVGFAEALLENKQLSSKLKSSLLKLSSISKDFPHENNQDVDFDKILENMRSLYKLSCSLAGIQPIFHESVSFISKYLPLVNSHMVEFFSNDLWEAYVPINIKTEFKENYMNKENVVDLFLENSTSNHSELGKFIQSCSVNSLEKNEVIIDAVKLRKDFLINEHSNMDCANKDKFMSEKKFHEVKKMSELVADLAMATDATHIIDVGDGKGYLSSYLSLIYKLQVLGVDSSTNLTQGAADRAHKLQKQWNSSLNKFNTNDESSSYEAPSKTKNIQVNSNACYKQATKFINSDTNLKNLLSEKFPGCIEYIFGLIGLHTCGNLSPICLRQFLCNNNSPFLVNIGCCYHLLEEGYEEESTFPMSNYLKQSKFTLGRNARMLSLQAPARIFVSKKIPPTLMFRAVFESFMEHKIGKCIDKGREVGRMGSKCSSFVEYSKKGIKKLGYDIEVSDEEMDNFFEKYAPYHQFLEFYFMMRVILAPVIENIILLDRLLYLQENGIKHSFLVKLFDPYVSPRCYGIVALRDKQ